MNTLLTLKQPKADSPRYRDFVTSFGCCYEPFMEPGDFCEGEIEFHHDPPYSAGSGDERGKGLCHKHHRDFHDAKPAIRKFFKENGERLGYKYLGAYLLAMEQANGVAPAPKRKQRKSERTNRGPLKRTTNIFDSTTGTFIDNKGGE